MEKRCEALSEGESDISKLINFEKTEDNIKEMKNILKAKEKFNDFMDAYNQIDKKYQLTAFEMCFKDINDRRNRHNNNN